MAVIKIPAQHPSDKVSYRYFIALITLLILSIVIKKGQDVLWINGFNSPTLDFFFSIVTNLGDGLIFIPIIITLLFVRFRFALMAIVTALLSALISTLFKQVLFSDFSRPKNLIDNNLLHFIDGVKVYGTHSFPSGHTMTAFCAALLITLISKNKAAGSISLVMALIVGYSRIYLLQHFLMDVAAGAIIGCLVTAATWQLFEQNEKPAWMNRKLRLHFKTKGHQLNRAS
jgi:membrane-associated phospholipid phosphatase